MRKFHTAVLAGVAAVAAAGAALAASNDTHFLKVAMPDGLVARIAYRGDVPPTVTVAPAGSLAEPVALFEPFDAAPFAMFDRIAAQLDSQAAGMMQEMASLSAQPLGPGGRIDFAAFGKLPASTVRYSFVSTSTDGPTCRRTVQVTSLGANQPPKVVSSNSGDCSRQLPDVTPAVDQRLNGVEGPISASAQATSRDITAHALKSAT